LKSDKQLWLLAGGNDAGKTTFYKTRLEPLGLSFINADILAKQLDPEAPEKQSYQAAKIAEVMRFQLLHQGRSFCFETVFSHPSKIDFIAQAKALGYEIILVFIHLDHLMLNQARIAQRVSEGGHSVPEDKVRSRIPRPLKNIKQAIPRCDIVYLLDNSRWDDPFRQVVRIRQGELSSDNDALPDWAIKLLENYLE